MAWPSRVKHSCYDLNKHFHNVQKGTSVDEPVWGYWQKYGLSSHIPSNYQRGRSGDKKKTSGLIACKPPKFSGSYQSTQALDLQEAWIAASAGLLWIASWALRTSLSCWRVFNLVWNTPSYVYKALRTAIKSFRENSVGKQPSMGSKDCFSAEHQHLLKSNLYSPCLASYQLGLVRGQGRA